MSYILDSLARVERSEKRRFFLSFRPIAEDADDHDYSLQNDLQKEGKTELVSFLSLFSDLDPGDGRLLNSLSSG